MKLFDYLDKSDQKLPVLVNLVTPQGPEGWIYKQTGKVDRQFEEYRHVLGPRVCLKIHSRHLRAPLRGIFGPNSVNVARYASLIGTKSPTKWDTQLTESNFQTHPNTCIWGKGAAYHGLQRPILIRIRPAAYIFLSYPHCWYGPGCISNSGLNA